VIFNTKQIEKEIRRWGLKPAIIKMWLFKIIRRTFFLFHIFFRQQRYPEILNLIFSKQIVFTVTIIYIWKTKK